MSIMREGERVCVREKERERVKWFLNIRSKSKSK